METSVIERDGLRVFADYPGANICNVQFDDDTLYLEQDIRDSTKWWFYWNVGVESTTEQRVVFEFTNGEVVGPWGPAISHDRSTWEWLGSDHCIDRTSFEYTFNADERAYFAFSLPYQVADFDTFVQEYADSDSFERRTLTTSDGGRSVPLLRLGRPDSGTHLVFACRHHACESTASYVLEGVLRELLDDGQLLDDVLVHVVPFVDVDGVERGDQGKNRAPHDHNRDYANSNAITDDLEPLYRATDSIMQYVRSLDGDIGLSLDFHCPYKWGNHHDRPFFVRSPNANGQGPLATALEATTPSSDATDAVSYSTDNDISTTELGGQPGMPSYGNFMSREGVVLARTLEFPFFGDERNRVTVNRSRQFGRDLAVAIQRFVAKE